ncbi:MAG TPA: D-alanyl-D-alanine carboxypeptidase family protein [Candidatus Binataceae bacterium]|jgi:D-alanyl-D-alanine carboxypeptidase (penicillin-binding protein 5/6)|nr:D-alanyl-D-alanine carboxypeptidase family protein [Candidatus Binataceae bacterium]
MRRQWRAGVVVAFLMISAAALLAAPAAVMARRHARTRSIKAISEEGAESASVKLTAPYVSACVMEPTTGQVIFDQEMHKPWPLASMTKMMLMLIVAEKLQDGSLKLTDQVTASALASKMGGSQVYLREGESFSIDDMMKAVVVHSANDASLAMAEYVAGSGEAFVVMMNKRAHELGMNDTHYYSPHGLPPAPGQQPDISSAYDSAILARQLVQYPDILRWSAIDTCGFRNGTFELRNTNHLVRTYKGCDGLKTGFYALAGFNVAATARRQGLRLIAVVMGSPRKQENFSSATTLLSQGFMNYYLYPVGKKGAPIGQDVAVGGGASSYFKPVWGSDLNVFMKHGEEKSAIKVAFDMPPKLQAPIKAGQGVGKGVVTIAGQPGGSAPLVAPADIPQGGIISRLIGRL